MACENAAVTTTTTGEPGPGGLDPTVPPDARASPSHDAQDATARNAARPHFPCFDGLRAVAATMVVVHHAAVTAGAQRAGVLATPAAVMDSGVAVFFVISGFLIYRPFVMAHFDGRSPMRTRSFLWRRLLRVMPAYWAALTFLWALGSFSLGSNWWRYYLLVQTYWRDTVVRGGIIQAWSLCTEITFYLLIPVFSLAVRRVLGRRGRRITPAGELAAVGVLWILGFISRSLISAADPLWRGSSFQWLPTNLDLFAAGMAMAVVSVWAAREDRVRLFTERLVAVPALWWAAAVAVFVWYAYRVGPPDFNTGYTGWFWQQRQFIVAVVAVCLLVPAAFGSQDRGLLRRGLRSAPVVWLGLLSYGLYLWHFDWIKRVPAGFDPDTRAMRWPGWVHTPPLDTNVWALLAAGLGVGLLFAAVSWYLIEKPLQRLKRLV